MNKNRFMPYSKELSTIVFVMFTITLLGQNNPKLIFGLYSEISLDIVYAKNLDRPSNGDDDFIVTPEVGYKIGGTVSYELDKWLSLRSGLLFQQRSYGYLSDYNPDAIPTVYEGIRKLYSATVPVIVRLKPGKVFSSNVGAEFNFNLARNSEDYWDGLVESHYKFVDIALFGSLEFKLYRGLQIGTGISWGVTPWGASSVYVNSNIGYQNYTYFNRSVFINLQYVFGVKK